MNHTPRRPRQRLRSLLALPAATLIPAGCAGSSGPDLSVSDPAVGAGQGGAAALYLTLRNDGSDDATVVGASCDCSDSASLHLSEDLDGASMMTKVDSLAVPSGEVVELRPGGSHIMLEGLRTPMREGSTVDVTLDIENGAPIELEVPVVALESLSERVPR